jgi:hypothetical protein
MKAFGLDRRKFMNLEENRKMTCLDEKKKDLRNIRLQKMGMAADNHMRHKNYEQRHLSHVQYVCQFMFTC